MNIAQFELGPFSVEGEGFWGTQTRNCARLLWIRSGSAHLESGLHTKPLRPYTLICAGAQDIRVQAADRISGYSLEVGFDFLASSFHGVTFPVIEDFLEMLRDTVLLVHFSQRARCEAEWVLQRMLREDRNSPDFFWASMRLMLGQFLLLCYQQWLWNEKEKESVSAGAESVVNVLRDYIDGHLNEEFGLKQLSQRAGYAPSYLSSLFSRVNGQGVTEYISRKRIASAQQLLRTSNLKIVEICYRVGFKDLAHFNRTFKRFTGATPNQYRQSYDHDALRADDASIFACEAVSA
jgi:AraC-like DNA-binding protein